MQSLLRRLAAILAFTGFLNVIFFREFGPLGISTLLLTSLLFVLAMFYPQLKERQLQPVTLGTGALVMYLASVIFLRAYAFVGFVSFLAGVAACFYLLFLLYSRTSFFKSAQEFLFAPFIFLLDFLGAAFAVVDRARAGASHQTIPSKALELGRKIIVGLLIGAPFALILLILLSSADPIFASFTKELWKLNIFNLSENTLSHIYFTLGTIAALLPLSLIRRSQTSSKNANQTQVSRPFASEFTAAQVLVALVLGTFLVIQFPYIFVNVPFETDLSKFGVATYSEYVTKGFGEFMVVAAIVYFLLWLGLLALRSRAEKTKHLLLNVQLVVFAEFAIFLLSMFRRVYLYGASHGLSIVRIYGTAFLVWVLGITAILLLRHFRRSGWLVYEIALSVGLLVVFGGFNAEHFIVTVAPPTVNKRIDYTYLSRMSADGYAGWRASYDYASQAIARAEAMPLIDKDGRRELFYAGFILDSLLHHYHDEVIHGTTAQKAQYRAEQLEYLDTRFSQLQSDINAELGLGGFSASASASRKEALRHVDERKATLAMIRNAQDVYAQDIVFNSPLYSHNGYTSACGPLDRAARIVNNSPDVNFCMHSVYQFTLVPTPYNQASIPTQDEIGRLISTNGWSSRILSMMAEDMPHRELLKLMDRYFALYERVVGQIPDERTLEVDVSFDTPFLD